MAEAIDSPRGLNQYTASYVAYFGLRNRELYEWLGEEFDWA